MTLLRSVAKTSFSCTFMSSFLTHIFTLLLCPYLTSSLVVYSPFSFWTPYLSPFLPPRETKCCCYGNCSQKGERERQLVRLPLWRQKPIYGHFLSAGWEVDSTFYEHCVSFSCVRSCKADGVTDRERQRGMQRERWRGERRKDVWSLVWLILITGLGRNCLVIVRPSCFLPVAQYNTHYF